MICLHTVKWLNSSILPIYETLTGTTTPGQSGPGSNGNEGILSIPQSSNTEASLSYDLVLYPGHSLGGESSHSAETGIHSGQSFRCNAQPINELATNI